MDRIAEEAGVARQTIYNRFGSKEAVFFAAIDAHWEKLADGLHMDLDAALDPKTVLRRVSDRVMTFIDSADQIEMTRMVIAEMGHSARLAETFYQRGKAPLLHAFSSYIAAADRAGRIRCNDADLAASQFLGMVQEVLFWPRVMGLVPQQADQDRVISSAIEVWLAAYKE